MLDKTEQFSLLDLQFRSGDESEFNHLIENHLNTEKREATLVLAHLNLHCLYLLKRSEGMRRCIENIEYLWIDGLPVVWILNLMGQKANRNMRITFLDWQHTFFPMLERSKRRVFILGTSEPVIQRARKHLQGLHREIVFDCHHGYFTEDSTQEVLSKINRFEPDVLLVGMGMPKQEIWIHQFGAETNARVIMPVGGFFDYLGGVSATPPRWLGRAGFEWLYRLLHNPRRLAFRYLVEPWCVVIDLLSHKVRSKIK